MKDKVKKLVDSIERNKEIITKIRALVKKRRIRKK
jgi:hypothetical protein